MMVLASERAISVLYYSCGTQHSCLIFAFPPIIYLHFSYIDLSKSFHAWCSDFTVLFSTSVPLLGGSMG